jgi:hypothetical protein
MQKVGNLPLAEYMNTHFTPETYRRITHKSDPVPLLPFKDWGFIQHETELYIERLDLPTTYEDVRICEGNEDESCAASGTVNALQLLYAHRDYFNRLGLCVPQGWKGIREWLPINITEIDDKIKSKEFDAAFEI